MKPRKIRRREARLLDQDVAGNRAQRRAAARAGGAAAHPTGPCDRTDLPRTASAVCAGCGYEAGSHPCWPRADHPHSDPGDGRTECDTCGKYVWPATHSCKGVPVTPPAVARYQARQAER